MFESVAHDLIRVIDQASIELRTIDNQRAGITRSPDVWSIKQILGHLIDSASNNHQRFVRAQLATELSFPGYEQTGWVASQDYQARPWLELVDLWVFYNRHLAHVIRRIPAEAASVPCGIGGNDPIPLSSLAQDYVAHVGHHLEQIRQRLAG